jgi:hypothetical protein
MGSTGNSKGFMEITDAPFAFGGFFGSLAVNRG